MGAIKSSGDLSLLHLLDGIFHRHGCSGCLVFLGCLQACLQYSVSNQWASPIVNHHPFTAWRGLRKGIEPIVYRVLPAWTSYDNANDLVPPFCAAEHGGICYMLGTGHKNNGMDAGRGLKYINSTSQDDTPHKWCPELILPARATAGAGSNDDGSSRIL